MKGLLVLHPRSYLSEFSSPEVEQGPIGKLSSRRTRWSNNPEIELFVYKTGFACEWLISDRAAFYF
jgi:hypothetical protein